MLLKIKDYFKNSIESKAKRNFRLRSEFANTIKGYYYSLIGSYFSPKDFNEKLKPIKEQVEMLGITHLEVSGDIYTITLRRPGIFIGKRGENIEKFLVYLKENLNKKAVLKIKEDKIIWRVFPEYLESYDQMCS